jgi:Spy/CpxP family protein refolding chaperone
VTRAGLVTPSSPDVLTFSFLSHCTPRIPVPRIEPATAAGAAAGRGHFDRGSPEETAMRIAARVALAAVLTAGIVASTAAQPPRQGRGGGFGFGGGGFSAYSMLANNKVLQEELKVTDEQKDKLKEALKPIQEKQREMFQGINFREMTDEQRKELREKGEKIAADTKKAVEGVLKEDQTKRLTQVNYQLMGVNAFTNKDVETQLKVTEEQKEKIKTIVDEFTKDRNEIFRGGFQPGGDPAEFRKRMEENQKKVAALTKEAEEKIAEKLTDEQKTTWKSMLGDKIDVAKVMAANQIQRPRRDD